MNDSQASQVSMLDWAAVLNQIFAYALTGRARGTVLQRMDQSWEALGLDSLDVLMVTVYLCELWDVPNELRKHFHPASPQQAVAFVQQHQRRKIRHADEIQQMLAG